MRIALRILVFDGVGPFGEREELLIPPSGKTVVYAPNGHGKTAAVDLVRWLFLGDGAQPEFRSLESVVNRGRARTSSRSGFVEATLEVESRGLYRVRRTASIGLPSKLQVARDDGSGSWRDEPNPEAFLIRFFPRERIGFNLLTGEHIREFAKEVKESKVRESVEKLLRFPEIAAANNALSALAMGLEKREEEARSRKKSVRLAADRAARLSNDIASLDAKITAAEEVKKMASDALADLNKQIGALETAEAPGAKLEQLEALIKKQVEAQMREWENLQLALAPSWKALVKAAAGRHSIRIIEAEERYQEKSREWAMKQGEISQYREILALSECLCTRPIDAALRAELERRISALQALRPAEPPVSAVPIHMLKGWRDNDDVALLIVRLDKSYRDYGILCEDMEELEKQAAALRRKVRGSAQEELRELHRQRMRQERAVTAADADLRKLLEQRAALRDELAEAKRKAAKESGAESVIELASLVESYRRAFQELVTRSVPYYRKKLEERVQVLFASLYQKDPDARISFDGTSYLPRIKTADGAPPSEGEKLRLGIALLLAFRDIAAEQPFLLLDAPFAELDDEGTDRLLTLLSEQDSQIVVLTKNRLPPEPYKIVSKMNPTTYEMVYDASTKTTAVRPMRLSDLLRSDAR